MPFHPNTTDLTHASWPPETPPLPVVTASVAAGEPSPAAVLPTVTSRPAPVTPVGEPAAPKTDKWSFPRVTTRRGPEARRTGSRDVSDAKLAALFELYCDDPDEDAILAEGIERLCVDLEVEPDEFKVLVLAWRLGAQTMCRFTRSEFVGGCRSLRVDSVKALQARLPSLVAEVTSDPAKFKELYLWTFGFGLDLDLGQRWLPTAMAVSLWRLVFSQSEPPLLQPWLRYLEKHAQIRGIPADTWAMFLSLVQAVSPDLADYDDSEAWPSLFDDFVEYQTDQANQNVRVCDRGTPE